ncbi:MAG: type I restriction endonuclease subunit R [Solirubrobacterales bacterium]|nr:type I restriction endonuclease subunit R [Solirubrobacterales bacterium]
MTNSAVSEDILVEQPALAWLCDRPGLKWTHVHGADLAPDAPARERKLWSDVVLIERLRAAIDRINRELPPDAVQLVIDRTLTSTSPVLIEDHRGFHELLLSGVPVHYIDGEATERHARAWLVDFENPTNNEFLAVNQFTIIDGTKNRRPDILLFVNGLPLGQLELKAPGLVESAQAAVNQVRHYTETIPDLYRYVEIVGVSDLLTARVGTSGTPPEHFAQWKSMGGDDTSRSQLEGLIDGVFAPDRFLELVRDFVLFESDGARTWKVMAKYHQVNAVDAAVESVAAAMGDDRRGGLVWHTQGAGKTYTMVFLVNKLRRDIRFANPTIVAVTDRTDLDNQLAETFAGTHLAGSVQQVEEITGGPKSLHELLNVPAGGIVFTTIQKFAPARDSDEMPVLSDRTNVVVLADEAHRSQYATFAENITLALPNATRIGFTGTPVESADRSTRLVFGDYISIYRMRQAQEDRATVPIYYESRQIPLDIADTELLSEVEEVLETEEQEAASRLVTAWAKLEKVVGAPDRLEKLADDVHEHFTARCEALAGKAMVVAYSRRVAAELAALLVERLGSQAVACVISAQATDPPQVSRWRRSKAELQQVAKDFKDPQHELRIVVVKDMWLTGFDAPVLHTLYIDKPMRDHGLLQAIARVNRVFEDKPGGLVVDYIGIGEDLRASLRAYDDADLDDPVIPAWKAVSGLGEKYEVICALLHPAGYRQGELHLVTDPNRLFLDCYNHVLGDDDRVREFLDAQAALASWYALARTQPAVIELRGEIGFFNKLAAEVRKITAPDGQASPAAEQAVRQFMSEGLAAGEIVDVLAVADQDRPEISVLSDEFLDSIATKTEHPNVQIRLLEKLLKGEVRSRSRTNKTQAKLFTEQIEAVLRRYELRQISSAEVVERLVEIAKSLREARRRDEQLGLSVEEAAFYDALAGGSGDGNADPQLAAIASELVKSIRADLAVDWADRESTEAKIRTKIKRLLRKRGYKPPTTASSGGADAIGHYTQLILDQAKELYRYWPDVEDQLFETNRV